MASLHRRGGITVLSAGAPTSIAAAPCRSPPLPDQCVARRPIVCRAPTLHLGPRWRLPETVGLFPESANVFMEPGHESMRGDEPSHTSPFIVTGSAWACPR